MQVCTSLQTDNNASTPPLSFLQAGCPSCHPTNSVPLETKYVITETFQQASLLAWHGKTKPNTTKAGIHQSKEMYYNTNKLKPGLVAFYNMQPGNGASLFSEKEITKRGDE